MTCPSPPLVSLKVILTDPTETVAKQAVNQRLHGLYTQVMGWIGFKYHTAPTSPPIHVYTDIEPAVSGAEWLGVLAECHAGNGPKASFADSRTKRQNGAIRGQAKGRLPPQWPSRITSTAWPTPASLWPPKRTSSSCALGPTSLVTVECCHSSTSARRLLFERDGGYSLT